MLRKFSIAGRIVFFVALAVAMIAAMAGLSCLMTGNIIHEGTALAKQQLLDAQRARIKDVTRSSALGLAAMTHGQPEDEQLRIIADFVEKSRFEDDSSGYFYVYKGTVCVAHPTQKKLLGKDLANTADSRGVRYVAELSKVSASGGGFVDFVFPKPGAGDVFKLGYAENITGTPFWIGTGVYIDNVDKEEARLYAAMNALFTSTLMTYGSGFLAVLLLFFLPFSWFLVRSVTRPLAAVTAHAHDVSSGNLDRVITPSGRDEVSVLEQALRDMVDKLKSLISHAEEKSRAADMASQQAQLARDSAEQASREARDKAQTLFAAAEKLEAVGEVVSSAASRISAQIRQADESATQSAQHLAEAASIMHDMNSTVQEVAHNAAAASSASAETRERAQNGANIVLQSLRSIQEVQQVAGMLKGDMAQLNEHSQAITRIMNVISDIADQTNLLALNAAIEAARAGEAGRGFAVVADEVRKLAEKTMTSTHDVSEAIQAIQQSTAKSVESMDIAFEQITRATDYAQQSGRALEEIVSTADATSTQVQVIAAASEKQSASSEEINRSLTRTNDMADQTAQAMRDATRAVADLAEQAGSLTALIADIKK